MMRALFVASLSLFAARTVAADCMSIGLSTVVVTKAKTTVVGDGGILVASTYAQGGALERGDAAVHDDWRVRVGKTLVAPKIDLIAPGLAVYRIPVADQTTPVELEDAKHKVVGSIVGSKAKIAVFAAPKVKAIEFRASHMGRHSSAEVAATIDGAIPANAYAIVIADEHGVARSWGHVSTENPQFPYTHSDCGVLPNGTVVSSPGDVVTLFWVDTEGRRSAASKPMKITGKLDGAFQP